MVDRERLIKAIEFCKNDGRCDCCPYDRECSTRNNAIEDDSLALLREQSSDKNINIHGKWIRLTGMAPPEYHGHKICSVCECFAPYDPIHPWREMLSSYCPGCGAKMGVSEDG